VTGNGLQLSPARQQLARAAWPMPSALVPVRTAIARALVTITVLPAPVNMLLYAGDDFTLRVDVTDEDGDPFDLTGQTAQSQIRLTPQSEEIAGEFEASIDGSGILLHLTSQVSAALPPSCVWDVQISPPVITLAAGTIAMTAQVTR